MSSSRILIVFILHIFIYQCSTISQRLDEAKKCNRVSALAITDRIAKRKGFDKEDFQSSIQEQDSVFMILYELRGDNYGGGALFLVDRETCNVIKREFYQ